MFNINLQACKGKKCLPSKNLNNGRRKKGMLCFHVLFMGIKANLNTEIFYMKYEIWHMQYEYV